MFLKKILLDHYRNYGRQEFVFSAGFNLIIGPNASGKTNLMEAIYLLSSGNSFRAGKVAETVNYYSQVAHVQGIIAFNNEKINLAVVLTRGELNGQKVRQRKFSLDGTAKSKSNFVGHFLSVLFRPEDLEIIIDSPSLRRRFLDEVLRQSNREYYRADLSYRKGLRSRNKILEQIREGTTTEKALYFWDRLLIKNGQLITRQREELLDFLNQQKSIFGKLSIQYKKNIISEKRIEEKRQTAIRAGITLVGPHRDDFAVFEGGKRNLAVFGSRGEQRLGVLWLKLGQLAYLEKVKEAQVVLLLDDIFSELDKAHRQMVLDAIDHRQVIASSATPLTFPNKVRLIDLSNLA